jgi:adenylate cyclase
MDPDRTERRLAAILSADIVGYSRLMAEDEAETVRRLTAYRTEITNLVAEHRGRVVDFTGDNFLAEFPTATDAVEAAAEIQRVIKARNAAVAAGRAMQFRIGIHLGEVRVEDERLYGDGVNIAARLEGLADPGGICVSAEVYGQVQRRVELDFDDLGDQAVKNIPDPVHAYQLRERVAEAPARRATRAPRIMVLSAAGALAAIAIAAAVYFTVAPRTETPAGAPLTSIAVLPFEDMSPGGDQTWLADGMAEELIDALSRIKAFRVIARTSTFDLRGESVHAVGRGLNVGSVVEGSVRRSGDQVRVTAQLIGVSDGSHLWTGRYDRDLDDIFAVQGEIAVEVAEAIRDRLGVAGGIWNFEQRARYQTRDLRAYELLKEGTIKPGEVWNEQAFRRQINLCLAALEIDPDYAEAHALVGWGYLLLWETHADPREETRSRAMAAAKRALELDPTNPAAQNLLGWTSMNAGDWEGAEARYSSALAATPGHAPLQGAYGFLLLATGRVEDAATRFQRAIELDPQFGPPRLSMGELYLVRGDKEAAIEELERAVEFGWPPAVPRLAYAYHLSGMPEQALELFVRSAPPDTAAEFRGAFAGGGYAGLVRSVLNRQISESGQPCTNQPSRAATVFALTGEPDRMFRCLDESVRQRRPVMLIKVSPVFEPYRDDPRFTALLRRMNLEP